MQLLQNELHLLYVTYSSNFGWLVGLLIYTITLVYERRKMDKLATEQWCDSTNPATLRIFYPTWFETIKSMFPGYFAKLIFFIVLYFYVGRLLNYVIH